MHNWIRSNALKWAWHKTSYGIDWIEPCIRDYIHLLVQQQKKSDFKDQRVH